MTHRLSTDSTTHMKIALAQEWQEILKFKKINEDLMEHLCSSIRWIIRYARNNNLPLPEIDRMEDMLKKAMAHTDKLGP
jgi:hypothetical protein